MFEGKAMHKKYQRKSKKRTLHFISAFFSTVSFDEVYVLAYFDVFLVLASVSVTKVLATGYDFTQLGGLTVPLLKYRHAGYMK